MKREHDFLVDVQSCVGELTGKSENLGHVSVGNVLIHDLSGQRLDCKNVSNDVVSQLGSEITNAGKLRHVSSNLSVCLVKRRVTLSG